jgi:hypothetical protein
MELSATKQIDNIIKNIYDDWRGEILAELRSVILSSDKNIIEETKWKMASRPLGWPVWSNHGIVCFAEVWKDNVKLLFPKGAQLKDTYKLFNARLNSKDVRAIEFQQNDKINVNALKTLVSEAVQLNVASASKK